MAGDDAEERRHGRHHRVDFDVQMVRTDLQYKTKCFRLKPVMEVHSNYQLCNRVSFGRVDLGAWHPALDRQPVPLAVRRTASS